ncbi:MAG TPA: hypothetical protein VFZ04_11435 [Longimicrobiales bacterium]
MRNLLRLFSVFALVAMISALVPRGAFALEASCTETYAACLNVSGQLREPFRSIGDLECGAEYTGCVARKLKFW